MLAVRAGASARGAARVLRSLPRHDARIEAPEWIQSDPARHGRRRVGVGRIFRSRSGRHRPDAREPSLGLDLEADARLSADRHGSAQGGFHGWLAVILAPPVAAADEATRLKHEFLENVHPASWQNPEPCAVYDLVILGAGPAGLLAAHGAAILGRKVALIERDLLGGNLLNF